LSFKTTQLELGEFTHAFTTHFLIDSVSLTHQPYSTALSKVLEVG